jgi:serine phosphatase RsbU (regulator of sigma subunit)
MDIMPEHFVLFRPRDIVSGDYYWIAKHGGKTFIVAADCTGHGVPGAFMSMLGVAFLNEIVLFQNNLEPDIILNELRRLVKTTLGQTGKADEAKDGMDISLCAINWETQTIQWAGAYNPLFYFRDGEFNEIKADKMPIGIYIKDTLSFTKHEFQFQKGDTFYIFSDGYVDQFGGEDGRKFMTKSFKALLAEIQPQPLSEQIQVLEKAHLDWRGHHEQVDDICVIGFRM